jgi:copper transport protein
MAPSLARRLLLGVPLWVLLALVPSAAWAHADLDRTRPEEDQVLAGSPDEITLTFTEPVGLPDDGVLLFDSTGTGVEAEVSVVDDTVTVAPTGELADGSYVVNWRVTSADSHPVSGALTFHVGAPSPAVTGVPEPGESSSVDAVRRGVESGRYAGVLVAAGLVVFGQLLRGPAPVLRRRLHRVAVAAAVLGVLCAVALVGLTEVWQDGAGLAALAEGGTWSSAGASDEVLSAALLAAGLAAALAGRRLLPVALAGAALALGSLAVVGHTRTYGPSALVLGADLAHVGAAAVWVGGIAGLLLLLGRTSDADDLPGTVARWSTVAATSVLVLVVAGSVLSWRVLGSWDALTGTGYGRTLLVKVGFVVLVLVIAAWNNRHVVPRLRGGSDDDTLEALRSTVGTEAALLASVLLLTGFLVTLSPGLAA